METPQHICHTYLQQYRACFTLSGQISAGKDGPPPEVKAAAMIIDAAGADNVKHFDRYQHNKVFIKRDASGKAERVIFGSMNFSVRGLYVQANRRCLLKPLMWLLRMA